MTKNTIKDLREFFTERAQFTGGWATILEDAMITWPDSAPYCELGNPVVVTKPTARRFDRPVFEREWLSIGASIEPVPGEGWRVVLRDIDSLRRRVVTDAGKERYSDYPAPKPSLAGPKGNLP